MVVALKCVEVKETNTQMTYIMAFDLQGNILLPETKVDDHKYEGIEFIWALLVLKQFLYPFFLYYTCFNCGVWE